MNQPANRVIDAFNASIDGKKSALAGCDNDECLRPCLRKDDQLVCRVKFSALDCSAFIARG